MTAPVVIVGSGASGVHFARRALDRGHRVTMVDVGRQLPRPVLPTAGFNNLKDTLDDPVAYFLGTRYEAVLYPEARGEYYGLPPHKQAMFAAPAELPFRTNGFSPLVSYGRGGLAEAWTAGVYPLNDAELSAFPISYADLEPHYSDLADRIGICGVQDDLARFHPWHANLTSPLDLDEHSNRLLASYAARRSTINNSRAFFGRSRIAVLSSDKGDREACSYKGRCLWGCPTRSLYTPSDTLADCIASTSFSYLPQHYVSHFSFDSRHRIQSVVANSLEDGSSHDIAVGQLVLAAGTISSARIFLDSIYRDSGERLCLPGLMDNRQLLVPYFNPQMVGTPFDPDTYQYHQLAVTIEANRPDENVHCQITTLKTALAHPLIQSVPLDSRTALDIFRRVRSGLGIINVNFHDTRRKRNAIGITRTSGDGVSRSLIRYVPPLGERGRIRQALRAIKRSMKQLGCFVLPGLTHTRPMGASVHYAGTLPMSRVERPLTCSSDCRSHDFDNLYFVDGTTFPFLPAKNLTFTLMANAVRVADSSF